jgi:hypothetical protein
MTEAPSPVDEMQLRELHIRLRKPPEKTAGETAGETTEQKA